MTTHLLGVLEVLEEGVLVPGNALVDVGSGVGEALTLTRLAAEDTGIRGGRRVNHSVPSSTQHKVALTRRGWGRPCGAHQSRGCGIERNGS